MKKKAVSVCMTAVLAVSLLAGGAMPAFAAAAPAAKTTAAAIPEENCFSGSWERAASPELTESVTALSDRAFEGLLGASYTPTALLAARTTTAGKQYRVLYRQTMACPDAQEMYVVVTLQQGWFGQASIVDIGDALALTDLSDLPGAWQEPETPAITEEAVAAFHKATDGLVGVDYVPVALLSTQVVAGTNYRILCEATVVYPGEQMHYVVMTLSEDLAGNVSVLDVTDRPDSAA